MKLCFSTIGCPDWRFADIVSAATDLGYSAIEIRGVGGEIYAPALKELSDDYPRTKELLDRTGIKIACLTSGAALADHGQKGSSVDEAKAYVDLAAKVGAEFVRVMSTDKPYFDGGDIDLCKKQFAEVVAYAKGSGVTPLMETNGLFVDTALLARFLDEVGEGSGALWDVHHPYRFGDEKITETIDNLGERIKYVHLKDSVISGCAPQYKMMGSGDIPLDTAILTLLKNGYDGFFTLEWVKRWNKDLEEPGIVFAQYVNYMKKFA